MHTCTEQVTLTSRAQSPFKMWGVVPISILNWGGKGTERVYTILVTKQGGETLRGQGSIWVRPPSPVLPILAQLWVDSQVGNDAGDV